MRSPQAVSPCFQQRSCSPFSRAPPAGQSWRCTGQEFSNATESLTGKRPRRVGHCHEGSSFPEASTLAGSQVHPWLASRTGAGVSPGSPEGPEHTGCRWSGRRGDQTLLSGFQNV